MSFGGRYGGCRMAKILVATSQEPRPVIEQLLAGHELSCTETMAQAEPFLRERTFDLIICTIVFDESKTRQDIDHLLHSLAAQANATMRRFPGEDRAGHGDRAIGGRS